MTRKTFIIMALLILSYTATDKAFGASNEQIFSLANLSFADGRYDEAIDSYLKIIKKGVKNPDVYYNLANTYVKTGDAGRAILNYERALELTPGNSDVEYNLSLVRKKISGEEALPDSGLLLSRIITLDQSSDMVLFFYCLTFISLIFMVLSSQEARKRKMLRLGAGLAFMTIFFAAVSAIQIYDQEKTELGIVVSEDAGLYEVPMVKGDALATLPAGLKLKVIEANGEWFRIETRAGLTGWVKSETTGLI